MFWLTLVKDIIKILRAGENPGQVAGGFALGSLLGLSPGFTLQEFLLWLVVLSLNVNIAAALLALTLFALIAYLFDPLIHQLGYYLLVQVEQLRPLWTSLYNAPVAPLTRFNNTVVMGSLAFGLLLFVPLYIGIKRFVIAYRTHIGQKVQKWKIYQVIKKSALIRWYDRVRDLGR